MNSSRPAAPKSPNTIDLIGLPLHRVGVRELHAFISKTIESRSKALILNLNIHCACLAWKQPWLREFLHKSQLVFCDGDGVRWGARLLGYNPPPKVAFTRWIWDLAEFSAEKNYRLFLLGSSPGVAEQAAIKLKEKFPQLILVGTHHGYFEKTGEKNEDVLSKINQSQADILIICFGMPIQEKWLSENAARLNVPVMLPAGAVLDYVAGRLGKAPEWMIHSRLEWLFRVCEEPKRLFVRYRTEIPYFFMRIFIEIILRMGRRK
jgi:N-acetylglucosaminyldiphosphoundecaprenol N-acetyl-beta-D-mannosaminyltransferase